jgi:mRNA interferase MazF
MRRGEVWWVDFDERRPVVLLSEEEAYGFRAMQVVAPAGVDAGYRRRIPPGREVPAWAGFG